MELLGEIILNFGPGVQEKLLEHFYFFFLAQAAIFFQQSRTIWVILVEGLIRRTIWTIYICVKSFKI